MITIIMGVSGCGKTTIGRLLSEKMGVPYYDADDFHTPSNIEKMERNIPLNDEDRLPWLQILANKMESLENNSGAVLACSALKESYREILASKISNINWVYLAGSFNLIKSRIESRHGHYMKSDLLKSQFKALEVPDYGVHISIDKSPETIVNTITSKIKSS
jgi:carbohydrate kinase (thermoresistant glucokinase family)